MRYFIKANEKKNVYFAEVHLDFSPLLPLPPPHLPFSSPSSPSFFFFSSSPPPRLLPPPLPLLLPISSSPSLYIKGL